MGAWVTYGLGTDNQDLPGYVVIDGGLTPPGGLDNFNSVFCRLPTRVLLFMQAISHLRTLSPWKRRLRGKRISWHS